MHFNYYAVIALAFSIFIPGLIAVFKFEHIPDRYRPFVYLIWVGCVAEVVNMYCAYHFGNNIIPSSIYALCESLFLLWYFKQLGIFQKQKRWLYFLILLFVVIWFSNSFLTGTFGGQFTLYFDAVYAFCVVILSIRVVNDLLFREKELLKNPSFLICIGLIIFFTFQIIERLFLVSGFKNSGTFIMNVQSIIILINFLTNLIYALAVLWMRKKQAFTLQF